MIILLVIINHFLACLWFVISRDTHGPTWIKQYVYQTHWTYQYATSFHFCITQLTPASMDVQPQNMSERCFTIAVVISGLVGFSYVVGSITGSLAQLRSMRETTAKLFWQLRRYI